jgi:hypothetical protein
MKSVEAITISSFTAQSTSPYVSKIFITVSPTLAVAASLRDKILKFKIMII